MPAAGLQVHLLGSFGLRFHGEAVPGFDHARLQELLAYLLLHRQHPIARQQLAFLFWPDSAEEQARTNFRNLWHRLRRALPDADHLLTADKLAVQWRAGDACWLDVAEFAAALARAGAAADASEEIAALEQAVAFYGGELLPGCYSDWLLAERDRLAQAYAAALAQLAGLYEARRDYRRAIGHAQALLRHDLLHEPAYAQLMRLHALNDDRAASLHTYHTCATVLRRELDVAPGPATRELYERLLNARAQPSAPPPAAAIPLIGRTAEWAQLQQLWRDARSRPGLALITGETGIGKTRLAEALVEWVGRQGIPALAARCYAAGGELAYAPIAAWLRSGPRPPLAAPWRRELARLLPELLVEQPDLPPPEPLTEKWQRTRLFEALAHAILAGQHSLLLFLDDLQWCDRDTLDWLAYLLQADAARRGAAQLLVVATLRQGEGDETALAPWIAGLRGAGRLAEIALGPLHPEAALALADSIAGRPFDRALGPLLYQGSEGHPLFIVEMVRAGFEQARAPTADHAAAQAVSPAALPDRVRQVLDARLAQLSPPARGTVELAAVIGRAFTYDVLARATDLGEEGLVAALDECWRRRIIREQGGEAYDFSHDRLREAAYAGLSRARRRWLHGRVAAALAHGHDADLERVAGVLAGHYEAAGQPAPAIACYMRAAAAARRVYAHAEAQAALERASGLLDALPAADRCAQAAQLQEALGDLQELLAQHGPAQDAYAAALACAPAADAVAQARLHRKIGKTLENERAGYEQVLAEYAAAGSLLGAPDDGRPEAAWWDEWCQVQLDRLILLYWWRRPEEMAERIGQVRPLIEQHGTPAQRAALFGNLARLTGQSCRYAPSDAALAHARAALAAFPPAASPEARTPYQFALGFYLLWHGDLAEAEIELCTALAMSEQIGDISQQARCLAYLVVAHRRQAHVAEVEAYARRGLVTAEAAKMLDYRGAALAGLAWVTWRRTSAASPAGLAEAERLAQAALTVWQGHAFPYPFHWQALWPLIGITLAQDRLADAVAYARQLLDPAQQALPPAVEEPLAAALAAWDAGQPDAARDLLQHALDLAQQANFS